MSRKILFLMMFFIALSVECIAQNIKPIRYYPLDNNSAKELVNRKDGSIVGTTLSITDRFGQQSGALQFSKGSYVKTPNFFEGSTYKNGFTISFWIYIDKDYDQHKGLTPWLPNDSIYRSFYATHEDQPILGFYQRRDRAVVDRYVINIGTGNASNYGIWYWDPLNFTMRKGWYQIFLSYKTNMLTLHMFYPNGQYEYALHYLGIQNLEQATEWGLGSRINNSVKVLDDFKIYDQAISQENIKKIHAQEGMPNGMYTISSAFDSKTYIQTKDLSTSFGALLQVQTPGQDKELTMQWVFEPIHNKAGQCKIRMGYNNRYLSSVTVSEHSNVVLDVGESAKAEWIIKPAGDGYFFIIHAHDLSLYMKSVAIPFSSSRALMVAPYNSAEAPYYKWKFNLLYLRNELSSDMFGGMDYEVIDANNTAFALQPIVPFTASSSSLSATRGAYPSLLSHYTFKKSIDNSYVIHSKVYPTKAIHPKSRILADKQPVELEEWHSGWEDYYKFIITKPNPLGKQIEIKPVLAQTLSVYSGEYPTSNFVTFKKQGSEFVGGYYWEAFKSYSQLNANRQVSTIRPGIYKIRSMLDENKFLTTKDYLWRKNTNILLSSFNKERPSSYYWIVDYEKDSRGNLIKDGAYNIKFFGSDSLYIGSTNKTIPEGERIKTVDMSRDDFSFFKWFFTPVRDGSGSYYIESVADRLKHWHTVNSTATEMNEVEYSYLKIIDFPNSYKWVFEPVKISTPLEPGVYKISLEGYQIHTRHDAVVENIDVELGEYNDSGTYKWLVELNKDNTYSISLYGHTPKVYIHTANYNLGESTALELKEYNHEESVSYKWIISPASGENTYYLRLVGNMEGGYMHIFSNAVTYGTPLEIYKYIDSVDETYRWTFEKIK